MASTDTTQTVLPLERHSANLEPLRFSSSFTYPTSASVTPIAIVCVNKNNYWIPLFLHDSHQPITCLSPHFLLGISPSMCIHYLWSRIFMLSFDSVLCLLTCPICLSSSLVCFGPVPAIYWTLKIPLSSWNTWMEWKRMAPGSPPLNSPAIRFIVAWYSCFLCQVGIFWAIGCGIFIIILFYVLLLFPYLRLQLLYMLVFRLSLLTLASHNKFILLLLSIFSFLSFPWWIFASFSTDCRPLSSTVSLLLRIFLLYCLPSSSSYWIMPSQPHIASTIAG